MKRLETGSVVCVHENGEEDWPGVFVRGDDCFYNALCLENIIRKHYSDSDNSDISYRLQRAELISLRDLFFSVDYRIEPKTPRVKIRQL
jgi:hypothetical protein